MNNKNKTENKNGFTALMIASYDGNLELVRELIKAGENVNAKNEKGSTALMCASARGHLGIVRELIKAGADVNVENEGGQTALNVASWNGHLETSKYLSKEIIKNNENTETKETTEKIITKAQAEKYKNDLANLSQKVEHAKRRIAQANYQYKNSVAKIEKQRQKAEQTKELINITKIKIANQLATAQKYLELLEKYYKQNEGK